MERELSVEPVGVAYPVLAQKWGIASSHRLLAFSQKEGSFSKDNLVARHPSLKYQYFYHQIS